MLSADAKKGKAPNSLIGEKSPYLLQHAWNPVNWYPWGQEAFQKAKKEDKPIFSSLSDMPPATGAMSWHTSPLRTRK